jgi:hypothetical protein
MTPKSKTSPASALSILTAISESKLGFQFGKPQRLGESALSCVLPIIRETSVKRQYITYPETDKVSVVDSGSISKMKVSSVSTDNVFIRSGTIFKGGTQERTIVRSAIIFSGKTMDIEVRCVHATRGINTGAKVGYGGITPMSFDSANYTEGFRAQDQHTTWANVQNYTQSLHKSSQRPPLRPSERRPMHPMRQAPTGARSLRSMSSRPSSSPARRTLFSSFADNTSHLSDESAFIGYVGEATGAASLDSDFSSNAGLDDLHSAQLEFAKSFDDILSKITPIENQTGLALINHNGCQTIETFDVPMSWSSLHTDAVKRVGSHQINQNDSVFEYKPENAVRAVQSVLAQEYTTNLIYEHKPSNGEPYVAINGLTSREFVGEVVELDNRVIHLLLTKRAA